jgi:hypothetical protein
MKTSQTESILRDLQRGRSINPLAALQRYGCGRLAARVAELRAEGHPIQTEMVRVRTRDGYARVAAYRMAA